MRRKYRERFPRHRGLAIPTWITARASRTCRDCMPGSLSSDFLWSRWRGKLFSAFPAHAQPGKFTYLVRGPLTMIDADVVVRCCTGRNYWIVFILQCIVLGDSKLPHRISHADHVVRADDLFTSGFHSTFVEVCAVTTPWTQVNLITSLWRQNPRPFVHNSPWVSFTNAV